MKTLLAAILIAVLAAFVSDIVADVDELTSPIPAVFADLPRLAPLVNG